MKRKINALTETEIKRTDNISNVAQKITVLFFVLILFKILILFF